MYRYAIEILMKWKDRSNKKPMLVRGARQVGKTWLMKEFGRTAYKNSIYINFEHNTQMQGLFTNDLNISRIITGIELYAGHKIKPEDTLMIFDEIQEVPMALTSLKYFCENAPQYQIIAAGSLLGVALHPGTSFPVGKVEFMDLYPMDFMEFLMAMGKEQFVDLLRQKDFDMVSNFHQTYTDMLKYYYFVGGMPEVVMNFTQHMDFNEAHEIQERILSAYEQDFSKHAPNEVVPRIRMLWNSIPAQLAKENKKFIYGLIKEGARAKEYELAMLWLIDCGLVHAIHRINAPNIPLKVYEDTKAFKLYLLDIGLLSCLVRLKQDTLLDGNRLFKEFKGALTEQYVLQQLKKKNGLQIYYWSNEKGSAEVDFIVETNDTIIPIEVKAETNLQSKSLKVYHDKFMPSESIRTSMSKYKEEAWLTNLPLYAIGVMS